jgi:hypothetical protein
MDLSAPTHFLLLLTVSLIIFVKYTLAKRQRRERIELMFAEINAPGKHPPDLMRIPSAVPTRISNQER